MRIRLFTAIILCAAPWTLRAARPDLVIADFEGKSFQGWQATGDAFGPTPFQPVGYEGISQYLGKGVAFSGRFSFALKGTLLSPGFTIERDYISFLVAGEREPAADLGVELVLGGRVVRNASATHFQSAGEIPNHSYRDPRLFWRTWDVRSLAGQEAQIRVNDQSLYGAIAVDQFVQTDQPKSLATDATILFRETYRPQFHYTPAAYHLGDPNGLLYYRGTWHMFHQFRYPGVVGNAWGHAESRDLIHWQQRPPAIPLSGDPMSYSGTGVVDLQNVSGLQRGTDPPLLLFFTQEPSGPMAVREGPFPKNTQAMVYSTDAGQTWTPYAGNPILRTPAWRDRDPKVFYHEPTKSWVMVLSLSASNVDRDKAEYGIFRSADLKHWELTQSLGPGAWYWECPDLFQLPLDGGALKWLLVKGNGEYMVGSFDGRRFEPETGQIRNHWGGNYYATQTFNNAPGGRRIQMAWMNTGRPSFPMDYPGMPFNQQMAFPRELTLRSTSAGPRLFRYPIAEIESLYGPHHEMATRELLPGDNLLAGITADLIDFDLDIELPPGCDLVLNLRGENITYVRSEQRLKAFHATVPAPLENQRLRLRVLLDRTSIEVFLNQGAADIAGVFFPPESDRALSLTVSGVAARVHRFAAHELRSIYDLAGNSHGQ